MNTFKMVVGSIALLAAMSSQAYMVNDSYVGGDDHGWGDVIGSPSYFDVFGLDVSVSGTWVTVDIYTKFDSHIGIYPSVTKNGRGIGVGDLFLSTSWNPYGSSANGYKTDNAANGTLWSYGLAVDSAYSTTGGAASLYALNGATNDQNALLSQDFLKSGIYRDGQEVAVDKASATTSLVNNTGSWTVGIDRISFLFDTAGTGLLSGTELALHWAMLCGNDVIEGSVPVTNVAEPAVLGLFGFGLFGLALLRKRV